MSKVEDRKDFMCELDPVKDLVISLVLGTALWAVVFTGVWWILSFMFPEFRG
jgi:hypothetical protein